MIPNWKQFFAALLAISTAFSVVLGCEVIKKFGHDGHLSSKPAPPLEQGAQTKFDLSKAFQEMFNGKYKEAEADIRAALVLEPKSAFIYFKLAEVSAIQNNYQQAIDEATQALSLDPKWKEPYNFLIQVLLMSQKPDKAEALAKKLLEMNPEDGDAVIQVSRAYQAQGLQGPSILVLEEFIESYPKQVDVRREQAQLLVRLGRLDEAAAAYRELLELTPGDPEVWAELAQLEAGRSKFDEAAKAYGKELEINPADTGTRLELVKVLLRLGKKEEARKQVELAKSFSPGDSQVWSFSAFLYLQDDQVDKARSEYLAVLDADPKNQQAIYSLGLLDADAKDWKNAQNWFAMIPANSDLFLDAQTEIIWALYYQDKKDDALAAAQTLINEHPGKKNGWMILASLYQKDERYPEAIELLQNALKSIPGDADIFYALGMSYSLAGNNDKAVEMGQAALSKKPDDPELLNFVGYTWADMNTNLKQAEDYIRLALEKDPDNGAIIDSLGWVFFRKGQYSEALKYLSQAQTRIADDAEMLKHLGQVELKLGDKKKARAYFEKALAGKPRTALRQEIESLLKESE